MQVNVSKLYNTPKYIYIYTHSKIIIVLFHAAMQINVNKLKNTPKGKMQKKIKINNWV